MKTIVVLGAGLVGKAMALDLAHDYAVTVADINPVNLKPLRNQNIKTIEIDLSQPENIKTVVQEAALVIGAIPGFMGFDTLKTVIEAGKPIVDISFFDEDPFTLDQLAKEKNVTAIVDCGVAPGMSNAILGYHNARMTVNRFECYVGGLPHVRTQPYEYKAPFSPLDVIEEYTRPARWVEHGKLVTQPALSEPELMEFEGIGTLEAFNTDGLRSLLKTMNIPYMKEKTLRYPGHRRLVEILRETGFFRKDEIEVRGTRVRPLDVTAQLLFPIWQLQPEDEEFTVMKVRLEGEGKILEYNLLDRYDPLTRTRSMARTTGYTATVTARLVLDGHFQRKGISPPEFIGTDENCFQRLLAGLAERGVYYHVTTR
ncbi:MAG: saccharopine dehydrogenase [Gemmatimonadetes bacterium]|nr:MAG: saccharopine dehydrogenase [Gemmatimonadota bacterium]